LNRPVSLEVADAEAGQALGLILRAGRAEVIPYNSLLMVAFPWTGEPVVLRTYDIRDIGRQPADFPGEVLWGMGVAEPERPAARPQADQQPPDFATVVKDKLLPQEFSDPATSIEESGGKLLVMQRPCVHEEIEKLLKALRKEARRPILVTARWAVVNSEALRKAVGKDLPQILTPKEIQQVLELVSQDASRDLACVRLSCLNGQRSSSFGGVERAFVADYNVNGVVIEPIVKLHIGGAVADVKPMLVESLAANAPTELQIETRLSISRTDAAGPAPEGKEGVPPPGRTEAPASQSQDVLCTVRIPDGGAALFRLPVPQWLPDEPKTPEDASRGLRMMIVLLQAEQFKE
jgi:hypothetical protein